MSARGESTFATSLKRMSGLAWQGLEYRFELLVTEIREDRRRLIWAAILGQVALLAAFMVFICLNVLVLEIFSDTHRIAVAAILCGFYLLAAVVAFLLMKRHLKGAAHPFGATLEELRKDREALGRSDP